MPEIELKRRSLSQLMNIGAFGLAILLGLQAPAYADVEDILLEKGTITKEDWLKIKAEKEKRPLKQAETRLEQRGEAPRHESTQLLKGVELGMVFYFNYTYVTGDSFTADQANKGLNTVTANNNRGLAQGFHTTRTYLNVRKYFEGGHHARLTFDQMVTNVGGNSCPNTNSSAGNCHEASPFGLAGFGGTGRNNFFVKYIYYDHLVIPGAQLRIGMHQTPWIEYEEGRWTYRYLFPIFIDQQNFQTSSDLGLSLLGKVLNDKLEYHLSFQEGEGYQNTPDGRGFALLGRVSVEPVKGVIFSVFGHNERNRNGIEGFNPQRALLNLEFYDPASDRFKVSAQYVWADDGADIGKPGFPQKINVPATYNGSTSTAAAVYGTINGPSTSIPRFNDARGYGLWAWYRIPELEKIRFHGRYYFMKPNKETQAGNAQSYYVGISYDYSKWLAFSLDYTALSETVLGSATTVGTQSINTGSVCTTCGQTVKYDNQIVGLRALISF